VIDLRGVRMRRFRTERVIGTGNARVASYDRALDGLSHADNIRASSWASTARSVAAIVLRWMAGESLFPSERTVDYFRGNVKLWL